jgi:hypothetical protein
MLAAQVIVAVAALEVGGLNRLGFAGGYFA